MESMYVSVENDESVHSKSSAYQTGPRIFHRAVVLCLGLLSLCLLTGLISLGVHYRNSVRDAAAELSTIKANMTELLQDSETELSSLTAERDQLDARLSSLIKEKDQLNVRLSSFTAEKKLQDANISSLTKEKDQLNSRLSSVDGEKDQLNSRLSSLIKEKDQLNARLSSVDGEKDQLNSRLSSLIKEKDQLNARLSSVDGEKDQLNSRLSSMTRERDQLNVRLSSSTAERDQLNARLIEMTKDRDRLESLTRKSCPAGWTMFGWSCYILSSRSGAWTNARRDCQNKGADLVVINSVEEQKFLSGFSNVDTWIGLSDSSEEGKWKWVDGTLLSLMYWNEGEPNNIGMGGEDCGEMAADTGHKWNDLHCDQSLRWICEKSAQQL
ncbi:hypothetical protein Q5P01_013914 [Channa striata]|uniref:C-type lectin domain-containing protein n=1 Tax=Channa striata TaxID=64152 RepID=A0AA88MNS8_CHASR|nr:hypothetical protein Q5P01_013914 [Channa striata]